MAPSQDTSAAPALSSSSGPNAGLYSPALDVWSSIASDWDEAMGLNGNRYWQELEKPFLAKLLTEKQHKNRGSKSSTPVRALDISTGNGLTSRWLAAFLSEGVEADTEAVTVTATDGSPVMLSRAQAWVEKLKEAEAEDKSNAQSEPLPRAVAQTKFAVLDVTQPSNFAPFIAEASKNPFDSILMNMAIMDVPTLEPLAAALPRLLAVDGVFVGSLLHPVFVTPRAYRTVRAINSYDQSTPDELCNQTTFAHTMSLDQYLDVRPWKGYAVPGQERAQYYFHRPLHELLSVFLQGGQLALDGLEEPAFKPEHPDATVKHTAGQQETSTRMFTQFPQVMVFRLRRIK